MSAGTRSLVGEALGWVGIACLGALTFTHFDDLKTLTAKAIGAPRPAAASDGPASGTVLAASQAVQDEPRTGSTVELTASDNGHYHAEVEVDGRPIQVMVDTGATVVALTYEDAERAGIYLSDSDFTHTVETANGRARVAPITLGRVSIGDITVRDVPALVSERGNLNVTLLGMSFLSKLERVDMRGGRLVLHD